MDESLTDESLTFIGLRGLTGNMYVTGQGDTIINVHDSDKCLGEFCVIHNPSDHKMKDWPTHWRQDKQIMERICPHGIGHPDPDDIEYKRLRFGDEYAGFDSIHGCDGCCRTINDINPHLDATG